MKKYAYFLAFMMWTSLCQASLVNWTAGFLSSDPEVGASLQTGWLVLMYQDVNGDNAGNWNNELRLNTSDGSITSTGVTSDDIKLTFETVLFSPVGTLMTIQNLPNINVTDNADVYSVIVDASTLSGAGNLVVVDSSPHNVGIHDPAVDYNLGSNIAGSFQAIPEPAVASLIVIFGGGLLVGRRIFSKA